jgi:hypothetical protein
VADWNRILLIAATGLSCAAAATGGYAVYEVRQIGDAIANQGGDDDTPPQWAAGVMMQAEETAMEAQKAARAASRAEEAAQKACKAAPGYYGPC